MVQILEANPSFGSQFGAAIGKGLGSGVNKAVEFSKQTKATKKSDEAFKDMTGMDISGLAPEAKEEMYKNFSKYQAQENMIKRLFSKESQKDYSMGNKLKSGSQASEQDSENNEIPFDLQNLSPEDRTKLSFINPSIAKQATEEEKLFQKGRSSEEQKKQFAHKETEKYSEKLSADAAQGEEMKYGIKLIRDAIRSGKTGPTARNLAMKYLEHSKSPLADLFANPASGKMNVGMKTLASGFKQIMGSKPTEREFFWYENILPSLLKDIETNEAIVDYFENVSDFNLKAQEAADKIVEDNGGYRPIDLDSKVRQKMKPVFNNLISEGMGLMGEFESSPTSKKSKKTEEKNPIFTDFPDPKSYKNQILKDEDSGVRYKSDGMQWAEVQ